MDLFSLSIWEISILSSIRLVLVYIPTSSELDDYYPHILLSIDVFDLGTLTWELRWFCRTGGYDGQQKLHVLVPNHQDLVSEARVKGHCRVACEALMCLDLNLGTFKHILSRRFFETGTSDREHLTCPRCYTQASRVSSAEAHTKQVYSYDELEGSHGFIHFVSLLGLLWQNTAVQVSWDNSSFSHMDAGGPSSVCQWVMICVMLSSLAYISLPSHNLCCLLKQGYQSELMGTHPKSFIST